MRTLSAPPLLAAGLVAGLALVAPTAGPALAQITTNPSALDGLGHPAPHPAPRAAHRPAGRAASGHRHDAAPAAPKRHVGAASRAPAATIPAASPPMPVFRAPVIAVPLHPPPPPPPVPVVQTATGTASVLPDGTRIGFGPDSADLNPATMQALHGIADRMKADPVIRADLDAVAAGTPDDPSTPRRLALSRGLAARAVLINDGIASTRIYVRMAPNAAAEPAAGSDRVDIHLSATPGSGPVTPIPGLQGPAAAGADTP